MSLWHVGASQPPKIYNFESNITAECLKIKKYTLFTLGHLKLMEARETQSESFPKNSHGF